MFLSEQLEKKKKKQDDSDGGRLHAVLLFNVTEKQQQSVTFTATQPVQYWTQQIFTAAETVQTAASHKL